MINMIFFKDINNRAVAINPSLVSMICDDGDNTTRVYFNGGGEDYTIIASPFIDVLDRLRSN